MPSSRKTKHAAGVDDIDEGSVIAFGGSRKRTVTVRRKANRTTEQTKAVELKDSNRDTTKQAEKPESTAAGKENRNGSADGGETSPPKIDPNDNKVAAAQEMENVPEEEEKKGMVEKEE